MEVMASASEKHCDPSGDSLGVLELALPDDEDPPAGVVNQSEESDLRSGSLKMK